VPVDQGCNDEHYWQLFKPVVNNAHEKFKPDVIVMQCGADSLGYDIIGILNLSSIGHAKCVKHVKG